MATQSEVTLLIRARDDASATLRSLNRELGESGTKMTGLSKTADTLRKKFAGGQFFGSILSGVGLGSGMQIANTITEMISKSFREAAEVAKIIEDSSKVALDHTRRMMALRRGELTDAEKLVDLEKQARSARDDFDRANAPQFKEKNFLSGDYLETVTKGQVLIPKTIEQEKEISQLRKETNDADYALLKFKTDQEKKLTSELTKQADILRETFATANVEWDSIIEKQNQARAEQPVLSGEDRDALRNFATKQLPEQLRGTTVGGQQQRRQNAPPQGEAPTATPRQAGGFESGIANTIAGIGTTAQQVAGLVQDTIGAAVLGISDAIYGWVTGAMDFVDVLRNVGTSVLRQTLDALVNIGVQQLINGNAAKSIAIGWKALTSGLRVADTAETIAAETAKAPVLAANAAAASAASFGLSAVVGIAALALALGAFVGILVSGGFAEGGYTGAGGKYEMAGIVHRGEYVMPADAVERLGVRNLESMRYGGLPSAMAMAPASGGGGGRGGATVLVDNRREADRFRRGSPMETQIVQVVQANRYRIAT